ncbi:TcdA/TcdB catalytic glycosyltransferase domain-containing protein [Endozoicomonas euniceicola]|uniref:C80 family cysteine peptidase n=1 Tax=Endozoicomonas euniceicola TaxID=1234143 RepID=A0ABY6GP56_9GAMM|nr:TcdA/TcdB catalytic glycosyltransferase domain-containing protein [Endozoicomonas euniceicola]UYM14528.1 C80 family cysteine peptidase [Endozoicomonas euniceicola]
MPNVPAAQKNPLQKTIHFVVIGELTRAQALRIETWAKANPDWSIKLWKDGNSYFDRLVLKEMASELLEIDDMKKQIRGQGTPIGNDDWAEKLPDSIGFDLDILRNHQRQMAKSINRKVKPGGKTRADAVKGWLISNHGKSKNELDDIIKAQQSIYDTLKKNGVDIEDSGSQFPFFTVDEKKLYIDAAYNYADFTTAQRVMQLLLLDKHGGLVVDINTFPKINSDVFSEISDEDTFALFRKMFGDHSSLVVQKEDIEKGFHELEKKARLQALLQRLKSDFITTDTPLDEDYLSKLRDYGYGSRAESIIRASEKAPESQWFEPLGTLMMGDEDILMAGSGGGNEGDFYFLAAHRNTFTVTNVLHEAVLFFKTKPYEDMPLKDLRDAKNRIRQLLRLSIGGSGLTADQEKEYIDEALTAIDKLDERGFLPPIDPYGDVLGRRSIERLFYSYAMKNTLNPGTPFIYEPDRLKGGIHGVNHAYDIATADATPYDHKVIIIAGNQPEIIRGGILLFQRNPGQSSLVLWDKNQQRLIKLAGKQRAVTENSKINVKAHGNYLKVGDFDASGIADIIAKVVPSGGRVKKVRIDACSVEKFSHLIDPKLDSASQEALGSTFGGSLLRALEKKGISAGVVVTNNKQAFIDSFLGGRYAFNVSGEKDRFYTEIILRKPGDSIVETRLVDGKLLSKIRPGHSALKKEVIGKKRTDEIIHLSLAHRPSYHFDSAALYGHLHKGNILIPATVEAIVLAAGKEDFSGKIIALGNPEYAEGIQWVLNETMTSSSANAWLSKVKKYFGLDAGVMFTRIQKEYSKGRNINKRTMMALPLKNLKKRIANGQIEVVAGSFEDADIIKARYNEPFSYVSQSSDLCRFAPSTRKRRSASTASCRNDPEPFADSLKLLSDDKTQIVLDGQQKDIALVDAPEGSALSKLQQEIKDYRRRVAQAALKPSLGKHSIIALDEASFASAKELASKPDSRAEAFQFIPGKSVLVSADGLVVPLVRGGSVSRVSLVGSPESFAAGLGAQCVGDVVADGRVGQLDALVSSSAQSIREAFPGSRLQDLVAVSDSQRVNTLSSALAARAGTGFTAFDPHGWQGHGKTLRRYWQHDALASHPPQSRSVNADIDRQLQFERLARNFSDWLGSAEVNAHLGPDYTPLLSTLTKTDDQWSMDFIRENTKATRTLQFASAAPAELKTYLDRQNQKVKAPGFRHKLKKLFKPTRTSGYVSEALSLVDSFQMLMIVIQRGKFLEQISKTEGMSDSLYRALVMHSYVNMGMAATQATELVGQVVGLVKDSRPISRILPSETKVVKRVSPGGAGSAKSLSTATRLTRYGKAVKAVRFAGKAVGAAGVGLMAFSTGLTAYEYSQIEDDEIKDLYRSRLIVESVGLAATLFSLVASGPVGAAVAVAVFLGMLIAEAFFADKMKEIEIQRKLQVARQAVEKFNDIYRELNPDSFFPISEENKTRALEAVRKILANPNKSDYGWVNDELKGALYPLGPTVVDRIFKKIKDEFDSDQFEINNNIYDFLNQEGLIPEAHGETADFYFNPATNQTFSVGLKKIDLQGKQLDYGRMFFRHQHFEIKKRGTKVSAVLFPLGDFTDVIYSYVKSDCKAGRRLSFYQCTDGIFNVTGIMPDKIGTVIMPARLDWDFGGEYTEFDDARTIPDSGSRRFFDAIHNSGARIKYYDTETVKGDNPKGNSQSDTVEKGYMIQRLVREESRHTDVLLNLDYEDHDIIFPPKIREPSNTGRGLLYTVNVPDNSKNSYRLIIKDNWSINLKNLENARSASFSLYYHGDREVRCINRYYNLYEGKHCGFSRTDDGFTFKLGGASVYFDLPKDALSEEEKNHYKVMIVDDHAGFKVTPLHKKAPIELLYFISKRPIQESAQRVRYFAKIEAAFNRNEYSYAFRLKPAPKGSTRYLFPDRFVPVILQWKPGKPAWQNRPTKEVRADGSEVYHGLTSFAPGGEHKWERFQLWYDRSNTVEITLCRPEGVEPGHVIPIMGAPETGYYFYNRQLRRLYFDPASALTPLKIKRFNFGQRVGDMSDFYTTPHTFPYEIAGYKVTDDPDNAPEKQLMVMTRAGVWFALDGLKTESGQAERQFKHTPAFISTTLVNYQEALTQVSASDFVTRFLPVNIVDTDNASHLLRSGFYDKKNNVMMTYLVSSIDFYDKGQFEAKCLKDSASGREVVGLKYIDALKQYRLFAKDSISLRQSVTTDCVLITGWGGVYLRLTPELTGPVIKDHSPVHSFRKGNAVYYVMHNSASGALYYATIDRPPADRGNLLVTPLSNLNLLTFGHDDLDARGGKGGFLDIKSLKNGILAYTLNGYILMIPNEALLSGTRLGELPLEAYRFDGWHYGYTDKGQPVRFNAPTANISREYYQLPKDSTIDLTDLDMGVIVGGLYDRHFGKDMIAPENRNRQQASAFLADLKQAVRRVCEQFALDFGEEAPDLLRLPLVHPPKGKPLPAFLTQMDFWFLRSENRLFAANASDSFRIGGDNGNSLMALKGEGDSLPYRFYMNPVSGAPAGHPYCRQNPVVPNLLPEVFRPEVSVPCEDGNNNPEADYFWNNVRQQWEASSEHYLFTLADGNRTLSGLTFINDRHSPEQQQAAYFSLTGDYSSDRHKEVWQRLSGRVSDRLSSGMTPPYREFPKQPLLEIEFVPGGQTGRVYRQAWYDTRDNRLFLGPKNHGDEELVLVGSLNAGSRSGLPERAGALCFNRKKHKVFFIDSHRAIPVHKSAGWSGPYEQGLGRLSNIEVSSDGHALRVYGSAGDDRLTVSDFLLDTLYFDRGKGARRFSANPDRPHDLTLYFDGKGGNDSFSVKFSDLTYCAQVIIKLEMQPAATPPGDNNGQSQRILIHAPAFQSTLLRHENDLLILDRFDPKGVLRIKQVWTAPLAPLPKPTGIQFNDARFTLDQLQAEVQANQGIYMPPLAAGTGTLPSAPVPATPDRPLFIDVAPGFQLVPKKQADTLKLTVQPVSGAVNGTTSMTVEGYRFARGSVRVRQLSKEGGKPASGYYNLDFDDGRGCHNCLSPARSTNQTQTIGGHEFTVLEGPARQGKAKYLAHWNNTVGFPVMGKEQLDDYGQVIDKASPYPVLALESPATSARQPVYSVFYDVDIRELRFVFESTSHRLTVTVWRGQNLVRKGQLNRTNKASLDVLLSSRDSQAMQQRYKVFPFSLSSLKLVARDDNWALESGDYRFHLGAIDDRILAFERLSPSIVTTLSKAMPFDGFVFAGEQANERIKMMELAERLAPSVPRLFDGAKAASPRIDGNGLNNILYIAPEKAIRKVYGHNGNDLFLLGDPGQKGGQANTRKTINRTPVELNGDAGDDIYDIRSSRNATVTDSQGQHTVILSSGSRSNLRSLEGKKSTRLYLTDLEPEEVQFNLRRKTGGSNLNQTTVDNPGSTGLNDTFVVIPHQGSELAVISLSALDSIYFRGRRYTSDPTGWVTGRNRTLAGPGVNRFGPETPEGKIISGQRLAASLMPAGDKKSGTARLRVPETNQGSARIEQHFQQLVQSLAPLNANVMGGEAAFVPEAQNVTSLNMTSPLANTTTLPTT